MNFAPVIYDDRWLEDYSELFEQLDDVLSDRAKAQLQSEIIFLTHNDKLHEVNVGWHPQGEAFLWRPDIQETKFSQTGGKNVRYRRGFKNLSHAELDYTDLSDANFANADLTGVLLEGANLQGTQLAEEG